MEELKKKVNQLFYATAAIAIVLLVFILYFVVQLGSTNNRVEQAVLAQNTQFAARLNYLEKINPYKAVTLTFYYDSGCEACQNENLVSSLSGELANLNNRGVTVSEVDVAGGESPVSKLPAFYATESQLSGNDALLTFFDETLWNYGFQLIQGDSGFYSVSPLALLSGESCGQEGNATVDAFYSSDDLTSIQLIADVKSEVGAYGDRFTVNMRCLPSGEDGENKCLQDIGPEALEETKTLAEEYEINPVYGARFVVDCNYEFGVSSVQEFKQIACMLKPEACTLSTNSTA